MEKPSEILKSLEERVTNPLLASFIFSFLTYNWKIPVALFFYSPERIRQFGYIDHFYFIEANIRLGVPIIIAISYTAAFPVIKYYLITWAKIVKAYAESLYLKKSKKTSIPFNKYVALETNYKNQTELIEAYLQRENEYEERIKYLTATMNTNAETESKKESFLNYVTAANQKSHFSGVWRISNMIYDDANEPFKTGNYEISSEGLIYWLSDQDPKAKRHIGTLEIIAANPFTSNFVLSFLDRGDGVTVLDNAIVKRSSDGSNYKGKYLRSDKSIYLLRTN